MRNEKSLFLKIGRTFLLVLVLLSAVLLTACGDESLISVREESEANSIMDVLRESQIKARKTPEGEGDKRVWKVTVASEDLSSAIQVVDDHCLGRPALDPIESSGLVASLEVEKAREQRRLKIQVINQLRELNGATCVQVNISPAEDSKLKLDPNQATASVLINYKTPTFPVGIEDIRGIVARAVPGLKPDNVNVVLTAKPLRPLPEKTGNGSRQFLLISGIGLATIMICVGIVFILQRRRAAKRKLDAEKAQPLETDENALVGDVENAN
jgi:type III secretory pathway lipoprotein EscJ